MFEGSVWYECDVENLEYGNSQCKVSKSVIQRVEEGLSRKFGHLKENSSNRCVFKSCIGGKDG